LITFYKKFSFWIFIILIASLGFFVFKKYLTPIDVKSVSVQKQDLEVTVTATSTGVIKSEVEVNITAQRTGKISKLYVEEGDRVKAGGLIADLETSEVTANLKKAEADLKKAEVDLVNAEAEYKRKELLFKEGLYTQQQFDDLQRRLSIAGAELDRAKAALDVVKLQYEYSFIRSPVDGVVSERSVDVGDTATPGPVIASVVDPDNLYIKAPVDEADVGSVILGQQVKITMDAYLGEVFYGKVIRISPIVIGARQEAKTFEVRVSMPEDSLAAKPGMSADVEIIVGEAKDTLVVSSHAIIDKGTEKIVYVVENSRAVKRKIETGLFNWNFTEVKAGLRQGDKVIITPDSPDFKEGVRVRIVDSP